MPTNKKNAPCILFFPGLPQVFCDEITTDPLYDTVEGGRALQGEAPFNTQQVRSVETVQIFQPCLQLFWLYGPGYIQNDGARSVPCGGTARCQAFQSSENVHR